MEYMTLKQYADKRGISYEAVRRMVHKYRSQLGEHIVRKNNTQLLDEAAVEFLTERRRQSPIVVVREGNEERIADLEAQVEQLKAQLDTAKDKIIALHEENAAMIEARAKYMALIEDHDRIGADLEKSKQENKALQGDLQESRREADALRVDLTHTRADLDRVEQESSSLKESLKQSEQESVTLREDLAQAKAEAESYTRTWFGLYRKTDR